MSVNSKMTVLADEIRTLSGTTSAMGLDDMATNVNTANTNIATEADLIAQIVSALEGKAGSGSDSGDGYQVAIGTYETGTEVELNFTPTFVAVIGGINMTTSDTKYLVSLYEGDINGVEFYSDFYVSRYVGNNATFVRYEKNLGETRIDMYENHFSLDNSYGVSGFYFLPSYLYIAIG